MIDILIADVFMTYSHFLKKAYYYLKTSLKYYSCAYKAVL